MISAGDAIKCSLYKISGEVFGFDFSDYLRESKRELYGIVINPDSKKFEALFEAIPESFLSMFNRSFGITKAGYEVDAGSCLEVPGLNADVFLLHQEIMAGDSKLVDALIMHELCHMLINSGYHPKCPVKIGKHDLLQGSKLFDRTNPEMSFNTQHDLEFCQFLAAAADKMRRTDTRFKNRWDVLNHAMKFDMFDI